MGDGLGAFLAHPRLQGLPALLETPGQDNHGPDAAQIAFTKKLRAKHLKKQQRNEALDNQRSSRRGSRSVTTAAACGVIGA